MHQLNIVLTFVIFVMCFLVGTLSASPEVLSSIESQLERTESANEPKLAESVNRRCIGWRHWTGNLIKDITYNNRKHLANVSLLQIVDLYSLH